MSAASTDPVAVLRARTHDAIVDLDSIGSRDAAAADAMHAVHLTLHTLRSLWMPALDRAVEMRRDG